MRLLSICFVFFNDTATTEIYTLSLHDALPISSQSAIRSISSTAPPSPRRAERNVISRLSDQRLPLGGREQPRQIVRQRGEPRRDLPLALLRLEQLVGDVERDQDRGLVRLHDRPQTKKGERERSE